MASLSKDQKDLLRLLSSNCHIGTKNLSHKMKPYVESKTNEGVHLINPVETLEKIKLAARIIVTVDNPEDVIVIHLSRSCLPVPTVNVLSSSIPNTLVPTAPAPPDGPPVP